MCNCKVSFAVWTLLIVFGLTDEGYRNYNCFTFLENREKLSVLSGKRKIEALTSLEFWSYSRSSRSILNLFTPLSGEWHFKSPKQRKITWKNFVSSHLWGHFQNRNKNCQWFCYSPLNSKSQRQILMYI